MSGQSLYHTLQRYRTLGSDRIRALPIVILMPHSACNCRCVMCDIWKGNRNLKQLNEDDIKGLLASLKRFGTRQVVMSGGEALLNPGFFTFCSHIKKLGIHITLLSTGMTLRKNALAILEHVDDLIVSLDGDEETHDQIRNMPGSFARLKEGVQHIKWIKPSFPVSSRTVIHRMNFDKWTSIIKTAKEICIDRVSFLPADISSSAFNREVPWDQHRQFEVALSLGDLPRLKNVLDDLTVQHAEDFRNGYIAESPEKLQRIYDYYRAIHGQCAFPYKKCNAPWVSTVIEPDGSVRPCFFHEVIGNIREEGLHRILNGSRGIQFRKDLDMDKNETCRRCVCYLNLPAHKDPAAI